MCRCRSSIASLATWVALVLAATFVPMAQAQKTPEPKPKPAAKAKPGAPAKPVAKPATKERNLRYISARSIVAVVVHPQAIFTAPQLQTLPIEVVEAAAMENLGIDLTKLDELVFTILVDRRNAPS